MARRASSIDPVAVRGSRPRIDPVAASRSCGLAAKLELLLESERWPSERLADWQQQRLDELLDRARAAPFYRDRLPAKVDRDDLTAVPVLERSELQEHGPELLTNSPAPMVEWRTSGTSGRPVTVLHGPETLGFNAASRVRHLTRFGLPAAQLPEAGFDVKAPAQAPAIRRIADDPPQFLLNPWRLDQAALPSVHEALMEIGGVRLLGAWPSMVEPWARMYEGSGLEATELGARLCVLGAEATSPAQRASISSVFGCQVGEIYGQREIPVIACECARGSLHINEERVLIEIVDSAGRVAAPGETGEIIATLLHSSEMPLIRYRTGDLGARIEDSCPCGLTLARLDLDVGRIEDAVVRADGRLAQSRFIRAVYEERFGPLLLGHLTEQTGPGRFHARLELGSPPEPDLGASLGREFSDYLGERVEVEVDVGPVQPPDPTRKRRTFRRTWKAASGAGRTPYDGRDE